MKGILDLAGLWTLGTLFPFKPQPVRKKWQRKMRLLALKAQNVSFPLPAPIWRVLETLHLHLRNASFLQGGNFRKMFAFGNSNLLLWVQQFSLVCGGEVAWMIPRLTSCPEMAQVLSASKPAQLVPGGGGWRMVGGSTTGYSHLTEGPSLLLTYKYTRGKFPRPFRG